MSDPALESRIRALKISEESVQGILIPVRFIASARSAWRVGDELAGLLGVPLTVLAADEQTPHVSGDDLHSSPSRSIGRAAA